MTDPLPPDPPPIDLPDPLTAADNRLLTEYLADLVRRLETVHVDLSRRIETVHSNQVQIIIPRITTILNQGVHIMAVIDALETKTDAFVAQFVRFAQELKDALSHVSDPTEAARIQAVIDKMDAALAANPDPLATHTTA